MKANSDDLIPYLIQALLAARAAGRAIMQVYDSPFAVELKDDRSPLTAADKVSHEIITESLADFPMLSEEGKDIPFEERNGWENFWLIDPLDGTKEFIKRNGEFTVNIALVSRGRPVIGVILAPARDLMFFAAEGLGAFRLEVSRFDGTGPARTGLSGKHWLDRIVGFSRRLEITPKAGPSLTVAGSRSHASMELEHFIEKLREAYDDIRFIPAGSSLKFCMVSEGNADIYPRFGTTMEWDTAAGHCIVNESGGEVVSLADRKPLIYNKIDLRNPHFICKRKDIEAPSS